MCQASASDGMTLVLLLTLIKKALRSCTACADACCAPKPGGRFIEMDDGAKIFAHIEGEGTPIVLVHGWGLNHTMWTYQIRNLTAHGYKVVAIDLRGFGQSDRSDQKYTYQRWAKDLETVIETLDLYDVTLVGYSIGGAIAMQYASTHQPASPGTDSRVIKLGLVAAAGPHMLGDITNPNGHSLTFFSDIIDTLNGRGPRGVDPHVAAFEQFYGINYRGVNYGTHPQCYFELLDMFLNAPHKSLIDGLEELRDEDLTTGISQIKNTTTICHGTGDWLVRPGLAEIQNEKIEHSTLVWFNCSDHGLFFQEDVKLNNELRLLLEAPTS